MAQEQAGYSHHGRYHVHHRHRCGFGYQHRGLHAHGLGLHRDLLLGYQPRGHFHLRGSRTCARQRSDRLYRRLHQGRQEAQPRTHRHSEARFTVCGCGSISRDPRNRGLRHFNDHSLRRLCRPRILLLYHRGNRDRRRS